MVLNFVPVVLIVNILPAKHGRHGFFITDRRSSVLHMASSKRTAVRAPFQHLTNRSNSGKDIYHHLFTTSTLYSLINIILAGQIVDPKELKRRKEQERYAQNKAAAANLKGKQGTTNTPGAISTGTFMLANCNIKYMMMHLKEK